MKMLVTLDHAQALALLSGLEESWQFAGMRTEARAAFSLALQHEETGLGSTYLVLREDGTWYLYTELKTGDDHGKV